MGTNQTVIERILHEQNVIDRLEKATRPLGDGKDYGPDHYHVKRCFKALMATGGLDQQAAFERARRSALYDIIYTAMEACLTAPHQRGMPMCIVSKFPQLSLSGDEGHHRNGETGDV